jgi:hypothetical protein
MRMLITRRPPPSPLDLYSRSHDHIHWPAEAEGAPLQMGATPNCLLNLLLYIDMSKVPAWLTSVLPFKANENDLFPLTSGFLKISIDGKIFGPEKISADGNNKFDFPSSGRNFVLKVWVWPPTSTQSRQTKNPRAATIAVNKYQVYKTLDEDLSKKIPQGVIYCEREINPSSPNGPGFAITDAGQRTSTHKNRQAGHRVPIPPEPSLRLRRTPIKRVQIDAVRYRMVEQGSRYKRYDDEVHIHE